MKPVLPFLCLLVVSTFQNRPSPETNPERERMFGVVRDRDGKPWVGATVHLLTRSVPFDDRAGTADHVVVESGKNGRFAARLLRGRVYSAWAAGTPLPGAESVRVTDVVEGARPRTPVRLREVDPQALLELDVSALAARWPERGPLRFGFTKPGDNLIAATAKPLPNGRIPVPVLAGSACYLEIFDVQGLGLHRSLLLLSLRARRDRYARTEEAGADPETLSTPALERVPLPELFDLTVRCESYDEPHRTIAGARVHVRWGKRWVQVGTTDRDGACSFQRPQARRGDDKVLLADTGCLIHAGGYAEYYARLDGKSSVYLRFDEQRGRKRAYTSRLQAHPAIRGRLLWNRERPARRHEIVLRAEIVESTTRLVPASTDVPRVHLTDEHGAFTIPVPSRHRRSRIAQLMLTTTLDSEVTAQLSAKSEFPLSSTVPFFVGTNQGAESAGDVVLTGLERVSVQVVLTDGRPARAARVMVLPGARRGTDRVSRPLVYLPDRLGRWSMLLPAHPFDLGAVAEDGLGVFTIPEATKRENTGDGYRLTVPEAIPVRGELLDKDRKPLVGAAMEWQYSTVSSGTHGYIEPIQQVLLRAMRSPEVQTDRLGRFELRLPLAGYSYQIRASVSDGRFIYSGSVASLKAGKDPISGLKLIWKQ